MIPGSGERAPVQQNMGKGFGLSHFAQEYALTKLQRGITADINCAGDIVRARLAHHNRATVIHGLLQGFGVLHAAGLRGKTKICGV